MKTYTVDATGKKLGRLATEVAQLLQGKKDPHFSAHKIGDVEVKVENLSKIKITEKKTKNTVYKRYSGFPGGLKEENFHSLSSRRGIAEAFKRTLKGMLPKNRLQKHRLNNLTISE